MSTISSFQSIENKHNVYKGKDCMKKTCESLREHIMKIINFKKKTMKLLTKEQQESYKNANICYIFKEEFKNKYVKNKIYSKVKDHCHYRGKYQNCKTEVLRIAYVIYNIVYLKSSYNGSNYDYHFIIKDILHNTIY